MKQKKMFTNLQTQPAKATAVPRLDAVWFPKKTNIIDQPNSIQTNSTKLNPIQPNLNLPKLDSTKFNPIRLNSTQLN